MKATRKLIPAIAMLLISAVMMSTATFAWFTSNSSVTASGMTVTAKANTTYLIIAEKDKNYAEPSVATSTTVTARDDIKIYPAAWDETNKYFYSATGTTSANGTLKGNKQPIGSDIEAAVAADYALKFSFKITVASGYENATALKLSAVTCAGASAVVVKCGNNYSYCTASGAGLTKDVVLADLIKVGEDTYVDVYVYIDGNDTNVTLDNYLNGDTNLNDLGVSITFTAGEPAAVPTT